MIFLLIILIALIYSLKEQIKRIFSVVGASTLKESDANIVIKIFFIFFLINLIFSI